MALTPTNRAPTGGTVSSSPTLPLASEPPDPTKALVNKPTIQPLGAAPTLPLAPAPGPTTQPSDNPTASQGGEKTAPAPAAPSAPSPYQTNDPLAFMPAPSGSMLTETAQDLTPSILPTSISPTGTMPAPTPPVTEGSGFLPPDIASAASGMNVPPPMQAPMPTIGGVSQTPTTPGTSLTNSTLTTTPSSITAPTSSPVNIDPTIPGTPLTDSTISAGPTADRFGIANDRLSQWDATEKPQFDRQIQDLSQNAAGRGQVGSGMVRGSFRDALNDEQTRRTTAQRGFLTDALSGSIEDAYRNVGIEQQQQGRQDALGQQQFANKMSVEQLKQSAEGQQWARQLAASGFNAQQIQQAFENAAQQQSFQATQQQQGFANNVTLQQLTDSEAGQQWQQIMSAQGFNAQQIQQAFENAYKVQSLSDDETGQAFNRALQQAIFGAQGNPADIEEWLAGLYALPQHTA